MIDTDKYEWDSKCRMVVIDGELYQRGSNGDYHLSLYDKSVAQLIADAPLFLEEVKRLQEEVEERITAHYTLANGWSRAEQEWEQKERRLHNHIHAMYHWAKNNLHEVHRDAWRQRYEKLYEEE